MLRLYPPTHSKQQQVVEVLNTLDVGTSILLDAQARGDFIMATAIEAVAQTIQWAWAWLGEPVA
jgi:hypothetical protein